MFEEFYGMYGPTHLHENRKEPGADREAAEEVTGGMRMEQKVIFNGQVFTLTRFWATEEPCLWITDPQQIEMPKMELVGGHPDEYCIFLKNLTETELEQITSLDGTPLDMTEELRQHLTGKDKPYGATG